MFRFSLVLVVVFATSLSASTFADPIPTDAIGNTATLDGNAFAAAVGLIHVNEAAGVGNRQANAATIVLGRISDSVLANAISQQGPAHIPSIAARNRVGITPGAFAHASGLVQVNQAAGNNNASINEFSLHVHP